MMRVFTDWTGITQMLVPDMLRDLTLKIYSSFHTYPHIPIWWNPYIQNIHLHVNVGGSEHSDGEEVAHQADGHHSRHQEALVGAGVSENFTGGRKKLNVSESEEALVQMYQKTKHLSENH